MLINKIVFRKKIKNFLTQYTSKKINRNLISNLNLNKIKNNKFKNVILNFSVISWDYRFQRPQHFCQNLSKKNLVFYIENEFLLSNNSSFKIDRLNNNLYKAKLGSPKNYFIYSDKLSKNNLNSIKTSLYKLISNFNSKNIIFKVDHPFWYQIIKDFDYPIIYDCMDDHSQFPENSKYILKLESKLINKSKFITTTSQKITQNFKKYKNKVKEIGNGVEFDYFSKPKTSIIPKDIPKGKIIFGYYGAIHSWIDEKFIEKVLKNKKINYVMIGRVENKKIKNLSKKYKNLYLLGEKPYSEIKSYLDSFDVCTIPFKLNKLILATDPVKLYEYMSTNKHIISSEIPKVLEYRKYVTIYKENNIEESIETSIKNIIKVDIYQNKIAQNNDWLNKTKKFQLLIDNCYNKKHE